ncbi:MAG: hypothetical protein ACFFC5_04555 [Promethearchaeota archaeon]
MVVATQVLTRLSSRNELPVSGYKNVGMHTLVPSSSADPLNAMLFGAKPDLACRRVLDPIRRIISCKTIEYPW